MFVESHPRDGGNKVKRLAIITPVAIQREEGAASHARSPRRLKILFLTNRSPYPITDGQSRRTYNILKGLALRHDVSLLSMYESKKEVEPNSISHLKGFCERIEMLPAPPKTLSVGMVVRLLRSLISPDPYTIWRHYSTEYANKVRAWLDVTPFDVVHCDILPLAYSIRDVEAPVCALTDHDVSYVKAERLAKQRHNLAAKLFINYEAVKLKRLERSIFRHVGLGITVSDTDRMVLQRLCPEGSFEVVENGVDSGTFTPKPDAIEPNMLVWVGGFHHYPNYEAVRFFLKEIYGKVKHRNPDVKFYIVGGSVPESLRRLTAADPSIVITGYVEDPLPYIQRATLFLAPILSGGGTKLKVLEAMAVGKAVVSTSIGVEGIEGEDQTHFMVADNPETFSLRVASLLNDHTQRERLGSNARKRAMEKYEWEAICEGLSRIYLEARERVRGGK